jgi:hypothetical protein
VATSTTSAAPEPAGDDAGDDADDDADDDGDGGGAPVVPIVGAATLAAGIGGAAVALRRRRGGA